MIRIPKPIYNLGVTVNDALFGAPKKRRKSRKRIKRRVRSSYKRARRTYRKVRSRYHR